MRDQSAEQASKVTAPAVDVSGGVASAAMTAPESPVAQSAPAPPAAEAPARAAGPEPAPPASTERVQPAEPTAEASATTRRVAANGDQRVIVLDPGHGGSEPGATRGAVKEKDLTLRTALRAAEILREDGWTVVLTRTQDTNVHSGRDITADGRVSLADDLQARIDIANERRAAAFVSIHYNAAPTDQSGTETFFSAERPHSEESHRLASYIQEELLAALRSVGHQSKDRGVRKDTSTAGGPFYLLTDRSYIKRPSQVPAALGEGLFLTNDAEFALIQRPQTIDAIALGYAVAIERFLSAKK